MQQVRQTSGCDRRREITDKNSYQEGFQVIREEDVVFCKVKKVEGTTVFLEIEDSELQGSMVLSEVAAGRIRNLKKYVSPNRIVVCKVLKVSHDHVELSLRRVTAKEKEEVMERHKRERALKSMLDVVKEDSGKVISEIKKKYDILEFFDDIREDRKLLEEFVKKESAEKIFKILSEKEDRAKNVERKFVLRSLAGDGLLEIKSILNLPDVVIRYIGSSTFLISASGKDFKEANVKLDNTLREIEKRAKEKKAFFEMKK